MTQTAASLELMISRVFDAPRELVYRAFTDPDQFAQWMGPVGYSVPRNSVQIDARIGGRERFVMVVGQRLETDTAPLENGRSYVDHAP